MMNREEDAVDAMNREEGCGQCDEQRKDAGKGMNREERCS